MRKINQKEHYFYIDILRILACLCVIYMQCNRIADPYTDTSVYRQRMFVENDCLLGGSGIFYDIRSDSV